jgi:hypothetical protein
MARANSCEDRCIPVDAVRVDGQGELTLAVVGEGLLVHYVDQLQREGGPARPLQQSRCMPAPVFPGCLRPGRLWTYGTPEPKQCKQPV